VSLYAQIVWGFYAIVTKVDDVYEVTLTAEVRQFISYIRVVFTLGLDNSTAFLTCLGLDGFLVRLIFWMLVPPTLIAMSIVGTFVRLLCEHRFSYAALLERSLPLVLAALFVMYPLVSNAAFEAFSCCTRKRANALARKRTHRTSQSGFGRSAERRQNHLRR
jgi:hypothetical protein